MRPLFHPSTDDLRVEHILHALADSTRFLIFLEMSKQVCAQTCSAFLDVTNRKLPKSTLSQHFKVLREAGLIKSVRHGVEMHNQLRWDDVELRFPGLLPAILMAYKQQFTTCESAGV